jgi:hypothetical protein
MTTLTHKTNEWGFGALLAYGSDARDLLPTSGDKPNYLVGEALYYDYLSWRLRRLPVPVQDVLIKATAYDANDRYDSCEEVLVDFEKARKRRTKKVIYQKAS